MNAIQFSEIRHFLVLGSGTLGLRVGLQAALSGFETTLYDIAEKNLAQAKATQTNILADLVKRNLYTETQAEAAQLRLRFTTDAALAAQNADFVNESVPEDLPLKQKVWAQFGELCPEHTVFTTNTSTLLPSMMAADSGRPERFCAFHFHDVFYANVVDIMPHPTTAAWVVDLLYEMSNALQQVPILVKKENHGYVFNAMLLKILGAAGDLLVTDVASVEDIDRSWMVNFKAPMGPFGILDTIGLETAWHVTRQIDRSSSRKFAELLKSYIDQGKLGVKTGEGFYKYPKPAYRAPQFVQANGVNTNSNE